MSGMRRLAYALALAGAMPAVASAQESSGTILQKVGFDQNLDAQLPADLAFRDETGRAVALRDYFGARPALMMLVYYQCPMLCGQELNGLARSLRPLAMSPAKDFDVIVVSIAPDEGPDLAARKKAAYMTRYGRPGTEAGWHFLTGKSDSIERLARTVGFRYAYNPRTKLYAHAAGLVILTPQGKIARYFYGIDFPAKDLQFGLIEASAGRIGSPIARVLLLCYDYDAATGKYTLAIVRLMRVLGTATALALAGFVTFMLLRERRLAAARPGAESVPAD